MLNIYGIIYWKALYIRARIQYQYSSQAAFTARYENLLGWTNSAELAACGAVCAAKTGAASRRLDPVASHGDALILVDSLMRQLEALRPS